MNDNDVRERLQSLPPELPLEPDRFDSVKRRVHRRRRSQGAAVGATLVVAAAAVPIALHIASSAGTGSGRGIDPTTAETSLPAGIRAPGAERVVELTSRRTYDGSGTRSVPLGQRPPGASATRVSLTCLSAGTLVWPDGASMVCGDADVNSTSEYMVDLPDDGSELVIRASGKTSWRVETSFVRVEVTEWGINGSGQTYGVANSRGWPDLVSVGATNGRQGYVYSGEVGFPGDGEPSSPAEALEQQAADEGRSTTVPVYESDGKTVIGEFKVVAGQFE